MRRARVAPLLAALVTAPFLPGCGLTSPDRDEYIAQNRAMLEDLPSFPGAKRARVSSLPYKRSRDSFFAPIAPITGYRTYRLSDLPRGVSARHVTRFYRAELRGEWRTLSGSNGHYLSMCKGSAYLHIVPGRDALTIWIDHDDATARRRC